MRKILRNALLEALFAVLLVAKDPLGLAYQQGYALNNLVMKVSQYFYPGREDARLAVVLIDDDDLQYLDEDWPLRYATLGAIAHQLACDGSEGVFFDMILARQRNLGQGANILNGVVEDSSAMGPHCADGQRPRRIPIFFSGVPGVDTTLTQSLQAEGRIFNVSMVAEPGAYPSGETEFPNQVPDSAAVTPAFGILRALCAQAQENAEWCPVDPELGYATAPIRLQWPGTPPRGQVLISQAPDCVAAPRTWTEQLWTGAEMAVFSRLNYCAPVLTLHLADLYRDQDFLTQHPSFPADILHGRFVFVGTDLAGINDNVTSPVHGLVPGVYSHAIAFDNLLTYGARYPTEPTNTAEWIIVFGFSFIIQLAAIPLGLHENSQRRHMRHLRFAAEWSFGRRLAIYVGIIVAALLIISTNCFLLLRWPASFILSLAEYVIGLDFLWKNVEKAYFPGRKDRSESKAHRRADASGNDKPAAAQHKENSNAKGVAGSGADGTVTDIGRTGGGADHAGDRAVADRDVHG